MTVNQFNKLKPWLDSLDPECEWSDTDIEMLEDQLRHTIQEAGCVNVQLLLTLIK